MSDPPPNKKARRKRTNGIYAIGRWWVGKHWLAKEGHQSMRCKNHDRTKCTHTLVYDHNKKTAVSWSYGSHTPECDEVNRKMNGHVNVTVEDVFNSIEGTSAHPLPGLTNPYDLQKAKADAAAKYKIILKDTDTVTAPDSFVFVPSDDEDAGKKMPAKEVSNDSTEKAGSLPSRQPFKDLTNSATSSTASMQEKNDASTAPAPSFGPVPPPSNIPAISIAQSAFNEAVGGLSSPPENMKDKMRDVVDIIALRDMNTKANVIFRDVVKMFLDRFGENGSNTRGFTLMNQKQVANRVQYVRSQNIGRQTDIMQNIELPEFAFCKGAKHGHLPFFQGQLSLEATEKRKQKGILWDRLMVFAHQNLLPFLLQTGMHMFVDGTFLTAPVPFYQMLVVSVWVQTLQRYYPIVYILMTGKTTELYREALHQVNRLSNYRCNPANITSDHEFALMNACKKTWPYASIRSCYFHFKQAIQAWFDKRKETYFKDEVDMFVRLIGLCCVVPPHEVVPKCLPYINKCMGYPENDSRFKDFEKYFVDYWCKSPEHIYTWNIYDRMMSHDPFEDFMNRTNNPVESYNKRLNALFKKQKPSFPIWLENMKNEADYWVELEDMIRNKRVVVEDPVMPDIPKIPQDYINFTPPTSNRNTSAISIPL